MKFKTKNNRIYTWLFSSVLMVTTPVWALSTDSDQPVHSESLNQSLDLQNNTTTLTGNVIVTQGSIKITADKMVITRPDSDNNKTIIDAYGSPATFYQMQDSGKPVEGHALHLHYDLSKDLVELTGQAFIKQLDSSIAGHRINYLVKEQKMQALSENNKTRVTTILIPSQLQDKQKPKVAQKTHRNQ